MIAVSEHNNQGHNHVELFKQSITKWQTKKDYPYTKDISRYSILAIEKKFIIFGGYTFERKVLTIQDRKCYEII